MSAAHKAAPRPRVILCGASEAKVEVSRPLAGSTVVMDGPEHLSSIHPEEHDVLVAIDADFIDHQMAAHRRVAFVESAEPSDGELRGAVFPFFIVRQSEHHTRPQPSSRQHETLT